MNRERWESIEAAFEKAMDLPAEERARYLATLAQSDATLARDVGALLAADDEPNAFLEGRPEISLGVLDALNELPGEDDEVAPGAPFGAWTVDRRIGLGGMGAVYLATRTGADFSQRAALKLVKRGMDSAEITRRFQAERRILARLEHPNIARVLDGGTTSSGQPWFCMEYVEGQPITDYCAAQSPGIQARLKLFGTVCAAVHYAHRNLVVHRDLKPSNILVTGDGTVKLLDFGIAKLIGGDDSDDATLTRTGVRPMTPRYASPEQVRGEPVTTATDVYSLGVILYELLCECLPYRDAVSGTALEDEILSTVPQRPSLTAKRATRPVSMSGPIAADLDDICLMALRKEPERRYASAEALREDIERHLNGLPVRATRDTVAYRTRKFLTRHRAGTAAAVGLLSIATAFGILYVTQLDAQRARAEQEAAKASEVASFLRGLFAVSDPERAEGKDVTARELLEQGAQRVETELAGQPRVQAEMMHVIGDVYHELGYLDQAQPLLERALGRRTALLGRNHPDVAETVRALAQLLVTRGTPAKAVPMLREALAIQQATLGREHEQVAETMLRLGYALNSSSQFDSAVAVYNSAIAIRRRLFGDGALPVAEAHASLAHTLLFKNEYPAAESLFRSALSVFRDSLSELHPNVRDNTFYLGTVLQRLGDFVAAESIYREMLRLDVQVLGSEHPDVATDMNSLAFLLGVLGKFEEADSLFLRALALRRRIFGAENRFVGHSLGEYGVMKLDWGDLAAADSLLNQGHAMTRRTLGNGHSNLEVELDNLGGLAAARGQYAQSRVYLMDAIKRNQARAGAPNVPRANAERDLARVLVRMGQRDTAEQVFSHALATLRDQLPKGHPRIAETLIPYGSLLASTGRASAAEPLLREALDVLLARFPDDHFRVAEARSALALSLAHLGRGAEAERLAIAGHRALAARFAPATWRMIEDNKRMADLYDALGRPAEGARFRAAAEGRR